MEAVVGLFQSAAPTTIAEGLAAGGTTGAGGWVTSVASSGGGLSSGPLSLLQGSLTQGQMLSQVIGGIGGFAQAQQQAAMVTAQSRAEGLASEERAQRIRREAVEKIGKARVAFAGSGVTLGGSADIVEGSIGDQAQYETDIEKANAVQRKILAGMRSEAYQTQGAFSLLTGAAKGMATEANLALDLKRRG